MERRGISIDRQVLARLSGEFAKESERLELEIQKVAGQPVNPGSPETAGRRSVRLARPARRNENQDRRMVDIGVHPRRSRRTRPRIAAKDPRLAAGLEVALDLYGCAAELRQSEHASRSHELRAGGDHRPAGCPRPSRICRTFRSATRWAARSAALSSPTTGNKLVSADYSQIELRLLAEVADVPALRQAFRDGTDIQPDRVGNVRRAGEGHAGRHPPPRQGDQFRHHLRHLGVRSRQSARHRARGSRGVYQESISSASPASATTWTRRANSAASMAM